MAEPRLPRVRLDGWRAGRTDVLNQSRALGTRRSSLRPLLARCVSSQKADWPSESLGEIQIVPDV